MKGFVRARLPCACTMCEREKDVHVHHQEQFSRVHSHPQPTKHPCTSQREWAARRRAHSICAATRADTPFGASARLCCAATHTHTVCVCVSAHTTPAVHSPNVSFFCYVEGARRVVGLGTAPQLEFEVQRTNVTLRGFAGTFERVECRDCFGVAGSSATYTTCVCVRVCACARTCARACSCMLVCMHVFMLS